MTGLEALLLTGIAAFLYLGNRARSIANLTFFPHGVSGMAFEGMNPVAYLDILVQNPSNVSIDINSLSGNVLADGTLVGNVSNFTPVALAGNSEAVVRVKVRLQLLGLVNDIISAFQAGHLQKNLAIDGTANVDGVQYPLNLTFQIGG